MTPDSVESSTFNRGIVIVPALIAGTITTLPSYALPFIVGSLSDELSLAGGEAGWVGTAVMAGFGLGSLFAMYWQTRWNWRSTCLAHSAIAISFYSLMFIFDEVGTALLGQFVAAAGLGGVYALTLTIFSRHSNPDRMMGTFMFVQIVFTSGYIFALSTLISRYGSFGISGSLAVMSLLIIPCLVWFPRRDVPADSVASGSITRSGIKLNLPLILALTSLLLFGLNTAGVASYLERMGRFAGLRLDQISTYVAIANLVSIVGPVLAMWWGAKFNRLVPLLLAVVCNIAAMLLLWNGGNQWLYPVGASLFFISWMLGLPYLYASVAALDETRTIMPIAAVVLVVGSAAAPAIAGGFVNPDTFNGVNLYGIACILMCYAAVVPALVRSKRVPRPASPA